MKLNAIKKACNDQGAFYVFNCQDGRQWLSNGRGAWPVEGIKITESAIPAIFDLSEKKQNSVSIRAMDYSDKRFTLEPQSDYEIPLEDLGNVWYQGTLYRALKNDAGMIFIDTTNLKPAESKEGDFQYFERTAAGRLPLVACYADFFVSALVIVEDQKTAARIIEYMNKVAREPIRRFSGDGEGETTAGQQMDMVEGEV